MRAPTGRVTWTPDHDPIEDARNVRQRLAECRAHNDNPPADQSNCPLPHTSRSYAEAMDRHLRMAQGIPPPELSA